MGLKFFLQWIILGLIGSIMLTARDNPKSKVTSLKTMYVLLWVSTLAFIIVSIALAPEDKLAVGFVYSVLYWLLLRVIKKIVAKAIRQ